MKDIFYNPEYSTIPNLLLRVACFIGILILLIWLLYFIFSKIKLLKTNVRKEIELKHGFLWATFVLFFIESVYFFSFFYFNGTEFIDFKSMNFYLGFLPQLVIYLSVIVYFFIQRYNILQILKQKSAK